MDRVLEHFLPQWKPVRRVVRQLIYGQIQMIERGRRCRFVDEASVGLHPLTPSAPCCHVGEDELKQIDRELRDIVVASAEFAQQSREPDPSELMTDIYL